MLKVSLHSSLLCSLLHDPLLQFFADLNKYIFNCQDHPLRQPYDFVAGSLKTPSPGS